MLVIFSGLPATGKTTLAREIGIRLPAVHVRVDTIEQALRNVAPTDAPMGPEGCQIAYAVVADNLRLGHTVIADSVNPLPVTRNAWRDAAQSAGVTAVDVEIVCSDTAEHRRRIETRTAGIVGLKLPNWAEVLGRDYRSWDGARLVIDTAGRDVDMCAMELCNRLAELRGS